VRYVHLDLSELPGRAYLDPRAYLAELPRLAPDLPPGARAFATDPGHYDFYGERCVKDLRLGEVRAVDDGALSATIRFVRRDADLVVRYFAPVELRVDQGPPGRTRGMRKWLGSVMLDEVLPHPAGVSHEVQLHGGTLYVVAADLVAEWTAPTETVF